MSRLPSDLPERLVTVDATDFERRVISAALQEKPPAAASARMARALGVGLTGVATALPAKALAADAAAKATAAPGAVTIWPWVSAGLLGLAVGGAVIGARTWRAARPEPAPASMTAPPPPPASSAPSQRAPQFAEPTPSPAAPIHHGHVATTATADLREEIALVDAARTAMSAGEGRRALEILRRYRDRYPSGSFRPEATAIKIEALMKLDRRAEARELAARFVSENRGSLLAARVAELVGLTESAAPP